MDPTLLSAVEQATLIADGELGAVELLDACVSRYRQLNPFLNAVVVERIDQARTKAESADRSRSAGQPLGPLHGVPVTLKEVIAWAGTETTWGDPAFRAHRPAYNAAVADRLERAGAVIWGKTNVPLNLGDWQTFNEVYGVTNNPWDLARTPGGSSGGSAVAVATGMSAVDLGSDIGGSIRFPAHYCGVFGHKPSFGAVPAHGHDYPGHAGEVDINVVGPLARTARDLAVCMRLLSDLRLPEEPRLSSGDFTVGVLLENPLGGTQDDEMTGLVESAISVLAAEGLRIGPSPADAVDLPRAQHVYRLLNHAATSGVDGTDADEEHAARYRAGARDYHAVKGRGSALGHREWIELHNERQVFRRRWADYFDGVDVVLCPVSASPAPRHQDHDGFGDQTITVNGREVSTLDQWFWAGIASGVYLPATAAPIGCTDSGLPVGVQIIAPWSHDLRAIRMASLFEAAMGGYVAAPMVTAPPSPAPARTP